MDWYGHLKNRPPLALVHGEHHSINAPSEPIQTEFGATVIKARLGAQLDLLQMGKFTRAWIKNNGLITLIGNDGFEINDIRLPNVIPEYSECQ